MVYVGTNENDPELSDCEDQKRVNPYPRSGVPFLPAGRSVDRRGARAAVGAAAAVVAAQAAAGSDSEEESEDDEEDEEEDDDE